MIVSLIICSVLASVGIIIAAVMSCDACCKFRTEYDALNQLDECPEVKVRLVRRNTQ